MLGDSSGSSRPAPTDPSNVASSKLHHNHHALAQSEITNSTVPCPDRNLSNTDDESCNSDNVRNVNDDSVDIDEENSGTTSNLMEEINIKPTGGAQKRDRFGRFKEVSEKNEGKSDTQKKRDKVFSKVSRWKKLIEKTIQKIQSARPEVSQSYVLETNILRGNKKPVIFKTQGLASHPPDDEDYVDTYDGFGDEQVGLTGGSEQIGPVMVEGMNTTKRRPADLYCFVCQEKLGSDNNKRIGKKMWGK